MRLSTSIGKTAFISMIVLLLYSSQMARHAPAIIHVPVRWEKIDSQSLLVDGAIYPEHLHGLPLLTISPEQPDAISVEVVHMQRTVFRPEIQDRLAKQVEAPIEVVSVRDLTDRGNIRSIVDIVPIQYDSAEGLFFRIENIDLAINSVPEKFSTSSTANLRTDESTVISVLASGKWIKIPVVESGVHKLDYNYLTKAGFDVSSANPKRIKLYGNGSGMLPQKNSDPRPVDLIENPIMIIGESDGRFDRNDYILFYGDGADVEQLQPDGELIHEKNIYSDTTYYFLTIADGDGQRIAERQDLGDAQPRIEVFDDYIIYEEDEYNIINSGREWYGKKFDFTLTYDFKFDFPDLVPNTDLVVTTAVMGQTYEEASLDISVNGLAIGQQRINAIVDGAYLAKGSDQLESFTINTSSVPASEQFTVRLSFNPVGSVRSKAYLNYLTVLGKRKLRYSNEQMTFRSLESTQHAISTFVIEGGAQVTGIWEVTDPLNPYNQKFHLNAENATFGTTSSDLKTFVIFDDQGLITPPPAAVIPNQNLHGAENVDLLIVTHPAFKSEADRLASFRESQNNLRVLVVTTHEIFNEFSSGKQDVTAIRDFVKYLYVQGEVGNRIANVLLFGKGSFDYKDRIDKNTNLVPTYMSRNSLHPINSYSSDDYFGFLDDDEGEWIESYSGDHMMDVGIGRLPVKTIDEAKVVVDKLIDYEANLSSFGAWRNELVFVADDGDGNLHQRDADRLATFVDTSYTHFNTNKIYVDAYPHVETSVGETTPGVNEEIERFMDQGSLILNFTGHGSPTRWASETILNITSAIEFENKHRLPLFVTATCEFGRHDNPKAISGAEYLLLNPNGGAIGLVTTARPVFSSTNFILNTKFYENVFRKEAGRYLTIGEVFRRTKNQSLNGSVNRNFSLLADPSMTLAYAKDEIILTANGNDYKPGDTLSALSTVKLSGQVLDANGFVNTAFNGTLEATIFDQPSEKITLGHEDTPMQYIVLDNIIFKGQVTVSNGEFEIEFIVPRNITYDFEKGKVSLYALDKSLKLDAAGSNIEFVVGGESDDFEPDNTPPEITLFINDTSFVDRGITRPDILLVGKLSDESGISLSKSADGNDLTAILDDEVESIVNRYYKSSLDTYKEGWVTYPYKDLSIGTHKIRLKAWDVHNNFSEAEIEFIVVEDENLAIEKLINFPNPVYDFTQFSFEHNRSGDDLEILIDILSMDGRLVKRISLTKNHSPSRISDIYWDGREQNGSKLRSGMYIFRLSIRSLLDGSKKQANQKLIIIN